MTLSYKSKFAVLALLAFITFSVMAWTTTIPNPIKTELLANVAMVLNLVVAAIAAILSLMALGVDILEAVIFDRQTRYR